MPRLLCKQLDHVLTCPRASTPHRYWSGNSLSIARTPRSTRVDGRGHAFCFLRARRAACTNDCLQFVLLLGMFAKPLMVGVQGTQSGGAVYRRLVLRTIICTAGIVTSYASTTLVVVLALLNESTENDKVGATKALHIEIGRCRRLRACLPVLLYPPLTSTLGRLGLAWLGLAWLDLTHSSPCPQRVGLTSSRIALSRSTQARSGRYDPSVLTSPDEIPTVMSSYPSLSHRLVVSSTYVQVFLPAWLYMLPSS